MASFIDGKITADYINSGSFTQGGYIPYHDSATIRELENRTEQLLSMNMKLATKVNDLEESIKLLMQDRLGLD